MQETQAMRAGEEVDTVRLTMYLRSELGIAARNVNVQQFPAGSSNLTYLVTVDDREYVLRRPPFGNTVRTAHDMGREFSVLSKLAAAYPPAPTPLVYCEDRAVIGSEFYLMERRVGLIIRGEPPAQLAASPQLQRDVCISFIDNLARLHALDLSSAGLADLGQPHGYVRRQVEGWSSRYVAAQTHELPAIDTSIDWLSDNLPADTGSALIHNDYKFDNIMLDPVDLRKLRAVLDWEMATVGDPLMDLGTTLGYWMSAGAGDTMLNMPFNPRVLMENITRVELAEMYAEASGRDISNILFYYVFGTFKIAVIAQQIYARYVKGATADERFAHFDIFVARLARIAEQAIYKGSI